MIRDALVEARLGAPWVSWLLTLACIVATAPMLIDPQLYLVLGADAPVKEWWHPLVTPFVHGGGWPGTIPHLVINSTLLLVFGGLVERVLGSLRFLLLSLCCYFVFAVIMWTTDYEGNGFSMVTWAYWIVAGPALYRAFRGRGWRALGDPLTLLSVPMLLFVAVGTIKWTHTVPAVLAAPFAFVWRHEIAARLDAIGRGDETILRSGRRAAIGVAAAMLVFQGLFAGSAALGRIETGPSCTSEDGGFLDSCVAEKCHALAGDRLEHCLLESCPTVAREISKQCRICLNVELSVIGDVAYSDMRHRCTESRPSSLSPRR